MKFNRKEVLLSLAILSAGAAIININLWLTNHTVKPTRNAQFAMVTVKITDVTERMGGSGVILKSSPGNSYVLTNAHICEDILDGGIVQTDTKKGYITSAKISQTYDLCLITVNEDFKVNTVIASKSPEPYDDANVSGHPELQPTIITRGHFTQTYLEVETVLRPCTPDEYFSPLNDICVKLGGIPSTKLHKDQAVSATAQPGSSGSPVFNSHGEIAGLVYAIKSRGGFGYGIIVKHKDIVYFLNSEIKTLPTLKVMVP